MGGIGGHGISEIQDSGIGGKLSPSEVLSPEEKGLYPGTLRVCSYTYVKPRWISDFLLFEKRKEGDEKGGEERREKQEKVYLLYFEDANNIIADTLAMK